MPLTDQQRAAVTCRGVSVVLSSGAGCGKTHVLTERYLSHLRDDLADVGQVVAITFTERAARQMRERIRAALTAELETAGPGPDAERWAKHLRDLDSAPISTIHAFCGTLLRQHAVAAGLGPGFEVLEEVLAASLRAEALADTLQGLLTSQSPAGEDLRELVELYGWGAVGEAVAHLAGLWQPGAWADWLAKAPGQAAADWLGPGRRTLLPGWVLYLTAAVPKIAGCLRLLERTPCLGPKTKVNVARILEETPRLAEAHNLNVRIEELTEAAKVGTEREKAWPDKGVYEAVKSAFEDYRKDLPEKLTLFCEEPENLAEAAATAQRFLRVADEAARAAQARKRRAGAADFQDLLVLTRDLLRDQPDVRLALQQRFRYLLVDELQDTDPVQMEVIEHLCGAGLEHGKLFAVGDHSQSIYRFRGAEVALFRDLRRRTPAEGRLGLTVNFRSQPAILKFLNALFRRRLADYEPLTAHHGQVNPRPCVEFLWTRKAEKESVGEARAREAEAVAAHVAGLIQSREPVVRDREPDGTVTLRPARPGDVVLLFRSMSPVAAYEAALRRYGLDYYLVGGRAFFAQQEVYDLLNLLRALENPLDGVSLAGALRSPFCCLSDEALYLLARNPDGPWAGLHDEATLARLPPEQRPAAVRARDHFGRWRALKDRLPIAELLGAVFADSGYDAATQFEFLGDRKLANLWKLTDLARTFDRSGLFGLAGFIHRLGELVGNQPREEQAATQPENADVVRLMSIHQAKGLEFPVVVLPELGAQTSGPRRSVAHWDAKLGCLVRPPAEDDPPPFGDLAWELGKAAEAVADWQEDLRTFYVACTRAEDVLVLSAALPEPLRPTGPWTLLLAEAFDLATGESRNGECAPVRVVGPASIKVAPLEREAAPEAVRPDDDFPEIGECSTPPTVVPLEALEAWQGGAAPVALAEPFAEEDDAGRGEWRAPWRRWRFGPAGGRDDVLRAVLARWDFADLDGWQHLLADALERESAADRLRDELAPLLRRLAASELRARLAAAVARLRDAEFLTDWPGDGEPGPRVAGTIDLLWQDAGDEWHLLAWDTGPAAGGDPWRGRRLALAVQAWAARQQLGRPPRTVGLYGFADGKWTQSDGRRLPFTQVFRELSRPPTGP